MKILITGASSGIGAELARQYAKRENELILLARREEKLLVLQKSLQECAKSVSIVVVDVMDFKLLQEKMKSLGRVDTLILNAGVSLGHTNEGMSSIDEAEKLYKVNVLANHAILEILLPLMVENKSGKVVFISSLASLFSMPSAALYASSKRAINAYAESLYYKHKKDGIAIINILPGFIKSELTDKNDFFMPFLLSTQEGALRVKKAIDKEARVTIFPFRFYLIIRILNLLPIFLREKIVNSLK